jgi:hypothetical protein
VTGTRPHRNRWAAVLVAGTLLLAAPLAGCRDTPDHRYMLYNDTSGQRQVSLCTDDGCSAVTSVGWVDVGAYADVTLPGDRVVLKVTSVDAGFVCAEGDDDVAGVLVVLSAVAPTADAATRHCVS